MVHFTAMKRRDLLKLLPLTAIAKSSMFAKPQSAFFEIPEDRKVIAFVNQNATPIELFAKIDLPKNVILCPISVPEGQTIDDVIRMYEVPQ